MSETNDGQNPPWQALQRRLAAEFGAVINGYPVGRKTTQPHWKFAPTAVPWLSKTRSGVLRRRATLV